VRDFIRALIVLHRAFRDRDLRTRFHVLVRFLTCPFLRVVRLVPANARVLDIGAGHGVFSVLAADRCARVVAVEPDVRKAPFGCRLPVAGCQNQGNEPATPQHGNRATSDGNAATRQPATGNWQPATRQPATGNRQPGNRQLASHYVIGYDDVVTGTFDAIAIIDVLYKIPIADWDALLTRARERLPQGGMLLVKEQDPTARIRNSWNRAQEWLASRLRLTLGESFSYESPAAFRARLERLGFHDVETRRIDFGYPHAHVVYVGRR
jgi:SAM-dependent methyltransferase